MSKRDFFYYHWSMDKPCTTNQEYGYRFRHYNQDPEWTPIKRKDAFDYNKPWSTINVLPDIGAREVVKPDKKDRQMSLIKVNINDGYVLGHTPVTEKIIKREIPVGCARYRQTYIPPAFKPKTYPHRDLMLWHAHAENLVQVRHFPTRAAAK